MAGNWIRGAIHHPGAFTRKADKADESTGALASKVEAAPGDYSAKTRRQAALARTLAAMREKKG